MEGLVRHDRMLLRCTVGADESRRKGGKIQHAVQASARNKQFHVRQAGQGPSAPSHLPGLQIYDHVSVIDWIYLKLAVSADVESTDMIQTLWHKLLRTRECSISEFTEACTLFPIK
jgi:hypothetical protein